MSIINHKIIVKSITSCIKYIKMLKKIIEFDFKNLFLLSVASLNVDWGFLAYHTHVLYKDVI